MMKLMRCSSCAAQNKDEAKFCEECGKPLVPGSDEEQIDRLVDYLSIRDGSIQK